jgi:purine-binding chemotaxis protein CheW
MADDNTQVRLITFRVGPETFVLDIMILRQIIAYGGSTPVPKAPDFIEGIIVLRDEVVPLIDLRGRFFPGTSSEEEYPLVLITESPAGLIGLKVDEVRRIITIGLDEILPAPKIVRGMHGDFFLGVVRLEDEVYMLVDIDSLLTTEEQNYLQDAVRVSAKPKRS